MEVRKVKIDNDILKPLEDLLNDFPVPSIREYLEKYGTPTKPSMEFTTRYRNDLDVYRKNQEILEKVIYERNKFFDTEDIDTSHIVIMHATILRVDLDAKVEWLIDRGLKLQHAYLNEVLNGGR